MEHEIVLAETKPETEWIRGRAVQKVSPKRDHSRLQGELTILLTTWARGRGEVGPEWRFRIADAEGVRRPLVPDVAFVANERLHGLTREAIQAPAFAPTVAVEILSPGDDPRDIAEKVNVYLGGGSELVIVFDPQARSALLHDTRDSSKLGAHDVLLHRALPDFEVALGPFFEAALRFRGPKPSHS